MLAVEVTRRAELAQQFMKEVGVTFPVVEDQSDIAGSLYQVTGTPTHFVIDRQGRIIFRGVGYAAGSENELRAFTVALDKLERSLGLIQDADRIHD